MSDTTIDGSDRRRAESAAVQRGPRARREAELGTYGLFAMWMSDVHSIGGYTFAAGLFVLGLVGWQVFVALVVGITWSSS